MIWAIDPGTEKSALLLWDGVAVKESFFEDNRTIRNIISGHGYGQHLVIEKVESYGMAVGKETFETVYWSGIFAEAHGLSNTSRMGRGEIKMFHCGTKRATDSNVRMAILDRFGGKDRAIGNKRCPGPLYAVTGHLMQALALAIAWTELQVTREKEVG